MSDPDRSDALGRLLRWEAFGAAWRVLERQEGSATVALLRCDAGEEVSRFTSDDPDLLRFLDRAGSAGEPGP